jgi:malate permease and related proteins
MDYLSQLGHIAYAVIGPLIVLVGVGYLIGRRMPAAPEILAKILLYFLIPIFTFQNILSSSLGGAAYGTIILFSATVFGILYVLARLTSAFRRHDRPMRGAFATTVILYNSANFAIPVIALAFPESQAYAVSVQVIVAACQGVAAYTIGAFIAAAGSGPVGHAALKALRIPFLYALLLAVGLQQFGVGPEAMSRVSILWQPITLIAPAYVPMALMTLGAQMARVRLVRAPVDLGLSLLLRLAVGPLLGLGLVKVMGLDGSLAQVLVIGVAAPTAIASAVVAIEFKNRPDFAASAVVLSTLAAAATVPVVIFLAQMFL